MRNKTKVNKVLILEVRTFKEKIKVYDFEVVPPIPGEMCGGFIIDYTKFDTKKNKGYGAKQECLDGDHVYHTMINIGTSKGLRKFVLKNI
jgi:hypothetical protein